MEDPDMVLKSWVDVTDEVLSGNMDGIMNKSSEGKTGGESDGVRGSNPQKIAAQTFLKSLTYNGHPIRDRYKFQELDISIENPAGSYREGIDSDGQPWRSLIHFDYGYIRGSIGQDKDHLDCFIGANKDSDKVFVIHQMKVKSGKFDEDKIMLGWLTKKQAIADYLKNYDRKDQYMGCDEMTMTEFMEKMPKTNDKPKMLVKAVIKQHTRKLDSGKVVQVKQHTDSRTRKPADPKKFKRAVWQIVEPTKIGTMKIHGAVLKNGLSDVAGIFKDLRNDAREKYFVVGVDKNDKLVSIEAHSVGGFNSSIVDPRIIATVLRKRKAAKYYGVHNHPSGSDTPSSPDLAIVRKIRALCAVSNISHGGDIIIHGGKDTYTYFGLPSRTWDTGRTRSDQTRTVSAPIYELKTKSRSMPPLEIDMRLENSNAVAMVANYIQSKHGGGCWGVTTNFQMEIVGYTFLGSKMPQNDNERAKAFKLMAETAGDTGATNMFVVSTSRGEKDAFTAARWFKQYIDEKFSDAHQSYEISDMLVEQDGQYMSLVKGRLFKSLGDYFQKALIKQHTRKLSTGKVVQVRQHTDSRVKKVIGKLGEAVRKKHEVIDGIDYELWENDKGSAIRVYDRGGKETVSLKVWPKSGSASANKQFAETINVLRKPAKKTAGKPQKKILTVAGRLGLTNKVWSIYKVEKVSKEAIDEGWADPAHCQACGKRINTVVTLLSSNNGSRDKIELGQECAKNANFGIAFHYKDALKKYNDTGKATAQAKAKAESEERERREIIAAASSWKQSNKKLWKFIQDALKADPKNPFMNAVNKKLTETGGLTENMMTALENQVGQGMAGIETRMTAREEWDQGRKVGLEALENVSVGQFDQNIISDFKSKFLYDLRGFDPIPSPKQAELIDKWVHKYRKQIIQGSKHYENDPMGQSEFRASYVAARAYNLKESNKAPNQIDGKAFKAADKEARKLWQQADAVKKAADKKYKSSGYGLSPKVLKVGNRIQDADSGKIGVIQDVRYYSGKPFYIDVKYPANPEAENILETREYSKHLYEDSWSKQKLVKGFGRILIKSVIKTHQRRTATGKVVTVREHTDKRTKKVAPVAGNSVAHQKTATGKADDTTMSIKQAKESGMSFDEWVKGQGEIVYRGGKDIIPEQIKDAGISVSKGKNVAEDFVKQKGGKVEAFVIAKNAKVVDYADVPNVKYKELNDYSPTLDKGDRQIWRDLEVEYQKAVNWTKENGYDAVRLPLEGETRIINPDVLKTRSQLKAEWDAVEADDKQNVKKPDFEETVKHAADWRSAAFKVAGMLKTETKEERKAAMQLSGMTTKGDLDAYLVKKFGLDHAEARQVSNTLTSRNIPNDPNVDIKQFKNEPWYKLLKGDEIQPLSKELVEKTKRGEIGEGGEIKLNEKEVATLFKYSRVGIVSAGRNPADPEDVKLSDKQIAARSEELKNDLIMAGYKFSKVKGHYQGEEDSFMVLVPDISADEIKLLGTKHNQDSVIFSDHGKNMMIYTAGENKGKRYEGNGFAFKPKAKDFYTEIKIDSGVKKFALNIDFSTLLKAFITGMLKRK